MSDFRTGELMRANQHFEENVENEERDRRRIAFFRAIVFGTFPIFAKNVKEFANDSIDVYTMYFRKNMQLNQAGDTKDYEGECYMNPINIYTPNVGPILHNRIVRKGFVPAECEEVTGYSLTALMLAKLLGREKMVKELIKHDADKDATTTIVYYRKGSVLGGRKERMEVPWTYMDFSANPAEWTQKGARRTRRRRRNATRRLRRV